MTRLAILLRTSFLILTLICASQTMARSQKYKVTIKVKEQKLLDVFKSIQQQTNLIVFYSNTILNDQEKVSIQVKDEPLEKVLDQIIAGKALKYEVQEKYIVIAPKEEKKGVKEIKEGMNAEDIAPLPPPTIDVSGRVTDEDGNPLFGASILVKGTKTGTETNRDGVFKLSNIDEKAILNISYVGYEPKSIPASAFSNSIIISLKRGNSKLDEVQIIAYGKTSQRFNVGNTTTIKAEDIEKQPIQNPLLALQGRVPGLEIIQNTGTANGAVSIRLQGQNSIRTNGNNPLIVVDGVPYPFDIPLFGGPVGGGTANGSSALSFINPDDIESIDVLKDADATAIYGSRAANGAILITTKKGKPGIMKMDVNIQQGYGTVPRKVHMLNRRQYLDMRYEAFRNDNRDWTQSNVSANDLKVWDTTRYTDWQDVLIGGAASYTDINATLSGGTEFVQYLVGTSFNRTTVVTPGDFDDKRGAVHFSLNGLSSNKRFKVQLSGNYMVDDNRLPGLDLTDKAIKLEPIAPALYLPDGSINWAPNPTGTSFTWDNPLASLKNEVQYLTRNLITNLSLNYSILKNLEVKTSFGYSQLNTNFTSVFPLTSYRPDQALTRNAWYSNFSAGSWIIEPQITYRAKVNRLALDILLGATTQKSSSEYLTLNGSGYASDQLLKNIAAATTVSTNYSNTAYRYAAGFGRINLNWDNTYVLNVNVRRDGSSRFGRMNQFQNFASIGGAWIFSNTNFMKRFSEQWWSFGKLRASYGTTGSDQIPDYNHLSLYSILSAPIAYQGGNGLGVTRLSNPFLHWESTRKFQAGIDLGFFKDRVLLNASFGLNRSSNQLLQYVLPSMLGFSNVVSNFPATVKNTSWEFMLNTVNVNGKNIKWNTSFNITFPSNLVESFPNIEQSSYASGNQGVILGEPIGITKIYKYVAVDPSTGAYLVEDQHGMPTSSPSSATDRKYLVSTLSKFFGGLQNQITFKGFQLDFLFQFTKRLGKQDLYLFNGSLNPGRFSASSSNQPISVLDRWQSVGDNALSGRFTANSLTIWANSSDAVYSYETSYIKLRTLSLSWQIPDKWIKSRGLRQATIYLQGQNLWTITGYMGLDPESGSEVLPPLRTIVLGAKIGF